MVENEQKNERNEIVVYQCVKMKMRVQQLLVIGVVEEILIETVYNVLTYMNLTNNFFLSKVATTQINMGNPIFTTQ